MKSCPLAKIEKRVGQVTARIFPLTNKRGFTLIEIMIAVAIIAMVVGLALPRINRRDNDLKKTFRQMIVLCREMKNRSKLFNSTHRLVISMDTTADEPQYSFWVEAAQGNILNNYNPEDPPPLPNETDESEKDEGAPPPEFLPAVKILKKPHVLPKDVKVTSVELASLEDPVTSGIVYVHFLPSGFSDAANIHLIDGRNEEWTLSLEPLTGRLDIIKGHKALEEMQQQ